MSIGKQALGAAILLGLSWASSAHATEETEAAEATEATEMADAAAGEEIYQSVCKNCHGQKAQGMASFPKLSDKDFEYITMRLEQYRSGEKVGANSALMMPHAAELSDDDIANLAEYITTSFD
ncbi:c-type cytochrome [Maribius pontilimi]|uniref:C-type cytochrome n=1 Tax=Palleronia pontilimi TaxID=1964209 RepID=A0A934ICX1_9RHOB|nr:c-type cytochrome [Palleronia pontilimi]MBJ3763341.1 c-type cytochrome [Palleronia pontilimi]